MGIIRRNKRRKIREANKIEPYLKHLLDETEHMLIHQEVIKYGDNLPPEIIKSTMDFITKNNSLWQQKCKQHDVLEIVDAYVDGVRRIKTTLKYANTKNTDK